MSISAGSGWDAVGLGGAGEGVDCGVKTAEIALLVHPRRIFFHEALIQGATVGSVDRWLPPFRPVMAWSRVAPPAWIFWLRRSRRSRAFSWAGVSPAGPGEEPVAEAGEAMLRYW